MTRRRFTKEFKASAVEMVSRKGYSVYLAAKELGIDHKTLRGWIHKHDGSGLGGAEGVQTELQRLRKENTRLRMERDILKKVAAFFVKEHA